MVGAFGYSVGATVGSVGSIGLTAVGVLNLGIPGVILVLSPAIYGGYRGFRYAAPRGGIGTTHVAPTLTLTLTHIAVNNTRHGITQT